MDFYRMTVPRMEMQLRRWREKLADLAAEAEQAGAEATNQHHELIDELKTKHLLAEARVHQLNRSSNEDRVARRAVAGHAWLEFEAALRKLAMAPEGGSARFGFRSTARCTKDEPMRTRVLRSRTVKLWGTRERKLLREGSTVVETARNHVAPAQGLRFDEGRVAFANEKGSSPIQPFQPVLRDERALADWEGEGGAPRRDYGRSPDQEAQACRTRSVKS
jgi:hypothetical protein